MTPDPAATVAWLRDVERRHRRGGEEVAALHGVELPVRHGELLAVMGPSGSGKSTLLHLLGTLDRPTRGAVLYSRRHLGAGGGADGDWVDTATLDDEELARLRREEIGFVFQAFHLLPTLDAEENVALPLILAGRGEGAARARARELLERFGLAARRRHRPDDLSGGERQRVAIARALAPEPVLILADEPTGNLDSVQGREILDAFRDLVDRDGRTVLLVTHDAGAAERADRVRWLRDGRLQDGPPA